MGNVSIYAIATIDDPDSIRYIGSAIDPAVRLRGHCNGNDSGRTRQWFSTIKRNAICYVIETVDSSMRLQAEKYWYARLYTNAVLSRKPLINASWPSAFLENDYSTSSLFEPKEMYPFCANSLSSYAYYDMWIKGQMFIYNRLRNRQMDFRSWLLSRLTDGCKR